MKASLFIVLVTFLTTAATAQNVGIGTSNFTPTSDALLEMRSTNSGFLMPRMSNSQKNDISAPTEGLLIYQTTNDKGFKYYDGSNWASFGDGGAADNFGSHVAEQDIELDDNWLSNNGGSEGIRINDDGNVGIGIENPSNKLVVTGANNDTKPIFSLRSGNNSNGFNDGGQIAFGYNNQDDYQHFIQTRHNSGGSSNNAIDFYTCNGTQNNTLTSGADHVMSLNGGKVGVAGITNPSVALDVNGDINARGGDVFDSSGDLKLSGEDNVLINMDYNNNDNNNRAIRFGKNSQSGGTELMRIQENGSVGIGSNNPSTMLHIRGNAMSGFTPGFGGAGPEIAFSRGGFYKPAATIQMIDFNGYSSGLCFNVHRGVNYGGGGAFADNWPTDVIQALTIINTGNVGVGSVNPAAKLHVQGDARITDLAGSGTRMVVADANGDLSTQAIPSGSGGGGGTNAYGVNATGSVSRSSTSFGTVSGMELNLPAGTYIL